MITEMKKNLIINDGLINNKENLKNLYIDY